MADNALKIKRLRELYDQGLVSDEIYNDTLKGLQTLKQDVRPEKLTGRSSTLSNLVSDIKNAGGMAVDKGFGTKTAVPGMSSLTGKSAIVDKIGDAASAASKLEGTSLGRLNGKFGKTMKALGILGPAIGAMAIGDKAMAGDFGGAGMEAVDQATDYVPVVGEVKQAITPTVLGNSELPPEEMAARQIYNDQARRGKGELPPAPIEGLEAPVRYADMQDEITKRFNVLNKMK